VPARVVDSLREELEGVLKRKYKLGPGALAALAAYAQLCEFVEPVALSAPVCRDPDDDIVLATALTGRVDYIVTGDEDLLVLKSYHSVKMRSPREFLGGVGDMSAALAFESGSRNAHSEIWSLPTLANLRLISRLSE